MTKLLYQRILVVLLALIVVFGGWFAADWQLRRAEATANWTNTKQVLILDAGHGGEDGGAVAPNGTVEADVNLQIALRARAIAELTGVEVVMTRDSPDIAYPDDATTIAERKKADQHQRAELIHRTDNAVLISIHQNSYHEEAINGGQVFYYKTSEKGKRLADILQKRFDFVLGENNRRQAKPNDTYYLLLHVKSPIVIVECGFLSNWDEAARLNSTDYQDRLAWTLHMGILRYLNTQ